MFDYTFELYQEGIAVLEKAIRQESFHIDYIVGIARGGAIPAIHLSHKLGVPCRILHWQTRDGGDKDFLLADVIHDDISDLKSVLIIDDINDSGKTIVEIEAYVGSNFRYASLLTRDSALRKPDFAHLKDPSGWVNFWWES